MSFAQVNSVGASSPEYDIAVTNDCETRMQPRWLPKWFGNKLDWRMLAESGPKHSHAKVYAFEATNLYPPSVLKEYTVGKLENAREEAQRLCVSSAFKTSQDVYGVYYDDEYVYIHSKRLKETVMSRIEKYGIKSIPIDKVVKLANKMKFTDTSSMCRVDNMMFDEQDNLFYIDLEKAEILPEEDRIFSVRASIECFAISAMKAHLKHVALQTWGEVKLMNAAKLHAELGYGTPHVSIAKNNFQRKLGEQIIEWFDIYATEWKAISQKARDESITYLVNTSETMSNFVKDPRNEYKLWETFNHVMF